MAALPPYHTRSFVPDKNSLGTEINVDKAILWATFTISFFGFLRSGIIYVGADGLFDPNSDLFAQDIQINILSNPQLIKIRLNQSKTDPFRVGTDIFMSRTHDQLCPVSVLLAWLTRSRNNQAGPLFYFQSGAPLTQSSFVTKFKESLSAMGLNSPVTVSEVEWQLQQQKEAYLLPKTFQTHLI